MSEYAKGDITWWSHMHTPEHIHTYTDRYSCDEKQTNERKDHREAYLRTTTYMGCNRAHYVRRRIAPFLSQPSTHACMHASFHPMLGAAVVDVRAPRSRDLRSNAQRVHFFVRCTPVPHAHVHRPIMSFSVAFSTTRATIARSSSAAKRFGTSSTTVATRAIVSDTVKGEHAEQYAELASLLENYQYSYKVGDKVHGKVVACDQKGALVEIGAKADALVPTSECSLSAVKNVRVRECESARCAIFVVCVCVCIVYRVVVVIRHSP